MKSKQIMYGSPDSVLDNCIKFGYLPENMRHFRQENLMVFDIETLEENKSCETAVMNTQQEARHNIVSLATGSNIPNTTAKFFARQSSDGICEQQLIKQFVDELCLVYNEYIKKVPIDISIALDRIESELNDAKEGKYHNFKLLQMRRYLESYLRLPVFGFNSCMY